MSFLTRRDERGFAPPTTHLPLFPGLFRHAWLLKCQFVTDMLVNQLAPAISLLPPSGTARASFQFRA